MREILLRLIDWFFPAPMPMGGAARSPRWPAVRAAHLSHSPACAACGSMTSVAVHHVVPFSVDPALELEPTNLLTLCESPTHNCHFIWGHFLDWRRSNPRVREMSLDYRIAKIKYQ